MGVKKVCLPKAGNKSKELLIMNYMTAARILTR
jgi:hypothetical protein